MPPLTVEGYGDMRIGMTIAEARQVSGWRSTRRRSRRASRRLQRASNIRTADGDQLWLMFEQRQAHAHHRWREAPHTRTAQNVGVGSTDAEVRTAYQNVIEAGRALQ